jgi:hypothetical protein
VLAVVILVVGAILIVPSHDLGWIDPITGSLKHQTRWFGIAITTVVEQSAIEKWVIVHEGQYSNTWTFLHDTSRAIWGRSFACGRAPEIYELHAGELNNLVVQTSSDHELTEFLQTMRNGSEEEKRKAVRTGADTAIRRFDKQ